MPPQFVPQPVVSMRIPGLMPGLMRLGVVAILGARVVLPSWISGQSPSCVVPASVRTLRGAIGATMWPIDADAPDTAYSARVLVAIGEAFQPPTPLALGEYAVRDSVGTASAITAVEFVRTATGAVDNVRLVESSLSPRFDSAAVDAVEAAGAVGLPPRPAGTRARVLYRLHVYIFTYGDTASNGRNTPNSVQARWLDTDVPAWGAAVPAHSIDGGRPPEYPDIARRSRVEDSLVVQFAVGPNGRMTPGTGVVTHGTYHEFVETISRWLATKTFQPATIGGCPVTTVVQEPFQFKMAR
jgi:TonB family protein